MICSLVGRLSFWIERNSWVERNSLTEHNSLIGGNYGACIVSTVPFFVVAWGTVVDGVVVVVDGVVVVVVVVVSCLWLGPCIVAAVAVAEPFQWLDP